MHGLWSKIPYQDKNMIYIKIHKDKDKEVVALCDKELIGKHFETKGLSLNITERFYKGDLVEEEKIVEYIKNAYCINIVGKNAIKTALKAGIISKENIIKIKGIPHAISL